MLYETLDDIPHDCEVPYENRDDQDDASAYLVTHDPSLYILPESNLKDLLDWD